MTGLGAGSVICDLSRARRMSAYAGEQAAAGMPREEFLLKLPAADYKIIRDSEMITNVPKRIMGPNHCRVNNTSECLSAPKQDLPID